MMYRDHSGFDTFGDDCRSNSGASRVYFYGALTLMGLGLLGASVYEGVEGGISNGGVDEFSPMRLDHGFFWMLLVLGVMCVGLGMFGYGRNSSGKLSLKPDDGIEKSRDDRDVCRDMTALI